MSISKSRLRRLNRRQRKKLHVGEFQEFMFRVDIRFASPMDGPAHDRFLDAFTEYVDAHALSVFGMGGALPLQSTVAWIQKAGKGSPSQAEQAALGGWLKARAEVTEARVGDLVDAWY